MLRLHPSGYAQHEREMKPTVLSEAKRSRRANNDLYGPSHLGSLLWLWLTSMYYTSPRSQSQGLRQENLAVILATAERKVNE